MLGQYAFIEGAVRLFPLAGRFDFLYQKERFLWPDGIS